MVDVGGLFEYGYQLILNSTDFLVSSPHAVALWVAWMAMCAGMAATSLKVFYGTGLQSFRSEGLLFVYIGLGTTLSFTSIRLFGYPPENLLGWAAFGVGGVISILGVKHIALLAFGYREERGIGKAPFALLKSFAMGTIGSGIILAAGILLVLMPSVMVIWLVLGCVGVALVVISYCNAANRGT